MQADAKLTYVKGFEQEITLGLMVSEFECQCHRKECKTVMVSANLIMAYKKLREALDVPLSINSGHRCQAHNREEGGASKSFHLTGEAIDIDYDPGMPITKYTKNYIKALAYEAGFRYVRYYDDLTFFHLDVGSRD